MISTFFIIAIVALSVGVPVAIALAGSSMYYILASGTQPMIIIQRLFAGINSPALLAIPFFVLAGDLMNSGGIAKRLVHVANTFLGKYTGSLGIVTIVGCMFFAAISGSGVATAAAMGAIMIPEMVKAGYDRTFSGSIVATASPIGVIIPPSISFILYAVITNCSVADLYLWGIPTGLFIGACLIGLVVYKSKKMGYQGTGENYTAKEKLLAIKEAFWALLTPIIIIGGVFGGIFTPTESAVVAVVYALIVGLFVYKEIDLKSLYQVIKRSVLTTAKTMFIISAASLFAYVLTYEQIPQMIVKGILGITGNPILILLITNVIFLVAGMFMETTAIFIILVPLLWPLMQTLGVDVIHFGMIITVNTAIGLVSPPFGVCLFTASSIGKIPVEKISKGVLPFITILIAALLIITYGPLLIYM